MVIGTESLNWEFPGCNELSSHHQDDCFTPVRNHTLANPKGKKNSIPKRSHTYDVSGSLHLVYVYGKNAIE